jgi:RNA polymerase sigma-70 factor (ECF subfamily)
VAAERRKRTTTGVVTNPATSRPSHEWELAAVDRAKQDPAAFAPLYEAHVETVWRYALSRLRHPERAADVTSQTFIKAITALPTFRPDRRGEHTTFRSWLLTIAHNVIIDELRRTRPTTDLDAPIAQAWLVDRAVSPEDSALASAERQRIERAVARLPETQRQIVELRSIGMKGAEIARLLDMTLAAVKTANHRAFLRLRDLLADHPANQDEHR